MMECSVRFVCETTIKDGRTIQLGTLKPALCVRGKEHALAVINDDLWVRTIEISLQDHDKASYVLYHGEPYDPKAFADRFLMSAKSAGKPITRRSKHLLTVRGEADEKHLPQEVLEREPPERERVYADNTPKERQRAAERPGPVKDVTAEYRAKQATEDVAEAPKETKKAPKRVETTRTIRAGATAPQKPPAAKPAPKKTTPVKTKANGNGKPAAERGTLIKRLAVEFKMEPFDLRVLIRSTGMRAPYEDEAAVRDAIKRGKKILAGAKK